MYSKVTAKGQITIPADIRRRLNIKPGMLVTFEIRPKRKKQTASITVTPVTKEAQNLITQLFGSLNKNKKIKYIPLKKARQILANELANKYYNNGKKH